jgi:hypothetical protein
MHTYYGMHLLLFFLGGVRACCCVCCVALSRRMLLCVLPCPCLRPRRLAEPATWSAALHALSHGERCCMNWLLAVCTRRPETTRQIKI